MARVASRSALSTFYVHVPNKSTPRRQSRERFSNVLAFAFLARKCRTRTRDRFFSVRNPQIPAGRKAACEKNLMVTPRLPRLPTLAVAHAPAGSHDRWVQSAAMVASRPTVMAPPRSHAPPRAFLAHFNAQKMANARLKHASGSRLTLRSKTAQARRSLTATQELRDTFATIDAEGTWGLGPSPARARTARTRPGRSTDGEVARRIGPTSALALCVCARRAVPRFPTFHAFSTSISAFRETRDCAARRKTLEAGLEKSLFLFLEKKKESSLLWFWFFCAKRTDARSSFRCFFEDKQKQTQGRAIFVFWPTKKRLR